MLSESEMLEKLEKEFDQVTKDLDEVLDDIAWRKPDVEGEEATLRELQERAKTDPMTDVATQAVVVRVLRGVLDDKLALAEALERRMLELQTEIESLNSKIGKQGEGAESGEALHKDT